MRFLAAIAFLIPPAFAGPQTLADVFREVMDRTEQCTHVEPADLERPLVTIVGKEVATDAESVRIAPAEMVLKLSRQGVESRFTVLDFLNDSVAVQRPRRQFMAYCHDSDRKLCRGQARKIAVRLEKWLDLYAPTGEEGDAEVGRLRTLTCARELANGFADFLNP